MKVGDLIQDKKTKDVGLILEIDSSKTSPWNGISEPYLVLGTSGNQSWLEKEYVEQDTEVINESG